MSSVFERLQKIAEEKRLKQKAEKPKLEVVQKTDDSLSDSFSEKARPIQPIQPIQPNKKSENAVSKVNNKPAAPSKDFQRVPNSITRDAIPNKFFKGTSKNTYDALFLRTRGAVNPSRTIKATKRELMQWIGISDVTLFKHLKHLQKAGLLKISFQPGAHDGSLYEVFIPEEITPNPSNPSNVIQCNVIQSNPSNPSNVIQSNFLGGDPPKKVGLHWMGNVLENKGTYEIAKTFLKTNTKNDDEPFGAMLAVLRSASEKVSGKNPGKNQKKNWEELAELLVMELEIAAARTETVSNIPAFLTEHLRRRLLSQTVTQKPKKNKSLKTDKSKSGESIESYQPEPLTEEGRKSTLKTFDGYIEKGQRDFLMNLSGTYTNEDWEWLLKNLTVEKTIEKANENNK